MTNRHILARLRRLEQLATSRGPDVHTFLGSMQRSSDRVADAVLSGALQPRHDPADEALIEAYIRKHGIPADDDTRETARMMEFIRRGQ